MPSAELQEFVKKHINDIEAKDFLKIYVEMVDELPTGQFGKLTELFYDIGIDPLVYLEYVPKYYLTYSTKIKQLQLPTNIRKVSQEAFWNSGLESITIPSHVELVCTSAFSGSTNLRKVVFEPGKCDRIGPDVFESCTHLSEVELGDVVKIGAGSFFGCISLTYLLIPEGTTHIAAYTFEDASITRLDLPRSIESIGHDAFRDCQVADIHYAGTVDEWLKINIDKVGNMKLKESVIQCSDGEVQTNA